MDIVVNILTVIGALFVLLILWAVWGASRRSRTPEARAADAAAAAAKRDADAALPAGWSLSEADRERYGAGAHGVNAYGTVAQGPGGERFVAIALSKAEAYRAALRAVRGELSAAQAWAAPVPALPAGAKADPSVDPDEDIEVPLPADWTLLAVDYESYYTGEQSLPTYGAMAVGPGGKRALAVTRDRDRAVASLVDCIEGRLRVTDAWAFQL